MNRQGKENKQEEASMNMATGSIPFRLEDIKTVQDVNNILIRRYKTHLLAFCQGGHDLHDLNMCRILEENPQWPVDKVSRWLGYIQRGMIDNKWTSVEEERNFSRRLFHQAYKEMDIDIPETTTVK
jgi:hypothetical protein